MLDVNVHLCVHVFVWVWCVLAPGTVSTFTCIFGFGVISFCLHLRLNRCSIAYARIPMRLTRMHNRRIVKSDFCSEFRPFWNFILVLYSFFSRTISKYDHLCVISNDFDALNLLPLAILPNNICTHTMTYRNKLMLKINRHFSYALYLDL